MHLYATEYQDAREKDCLSEKKCSVRVWITRLLSLLQRKGSLRFPQKLWTNRKELSTECHDYAKGNCVIQKESIIPFVKKCSRLSTFACLLSLLSGWNSFIGEGKYYHKIIISSISVTQRALIRRISGSITSHYIIYPCVSSVCNYQLSKSRLFQRQWCLVLITWYRFNGYKHC